MQHKFRNSFFAIIVSLLVICPGSITRAEQSPTTKKTTSTPASPSAPASATTTKSAAAPASTAATKSGTTGTAKVATVNGTAISQEQFDSALSYQREIAGMQGITITAEQLPELKYELLEGLIGTELLYQESQKSGIKVGEKEIDEAYEANKQKANFKTDAEFQTALKQSNKSLASYRAEIKQGLAIDNFIKSKFTDKTVISDSEAKKYYDDNPAYFRQPAQVRVSHIMISAPSTADQSKKDDARKKIEDVMKRVKSAEDFSALAGEVSEDASSKNNGGDLGYISKGQAPQSFEDAAFALKKGDTSDIVKTDAGYHIIKVTDKTDARTISYEEAKKDIVENLKTSKVNSNVNKYIKELKIKSTIVTFPMTK